MAIDKDTVTYVANLARIELQDKELEKLSRELHDILDFIDRLGKVDVKDVAPTSHILPLKNVLREDIPRESLPRQSALQNAPSSKEQSFSVPKVIE